METKSNHWTVKQKKPVSVIKYLGSVILFNKRVAGDGKWCTDVTRTKLYQFLNIETDFKTTLRILTAIS